MIYLLLIPIIALGFIAWLYWNEPRIVYHPDSKIEQTPDQFGLPYQNVNLVASDGVNLNGWFVPGEDLSEEGHGVKLTVLFFHGNAGNISHRIEKLAIFRGLGVNTFIIDYRGFGRSQGEPNEAGTYRDAQAAHEYLTQQRKLSAKSIVLYGESLGGAIASDLASKQPVGGLILEETFTSTADVGQQMFPFVPVRWLVRNKYETIHKLPGIHAPLLIFHSREDTLIRFDHGERLFAAANEPKQFVELHGGHNDAFSVSALAYRSALSKFFAAL